MKNRFIALFLLILVVFSCVGLYLVDIPAPSKMISEVYNLEIK